MFIHPCLPKLVINIFGFCGMVTLSLWISCVWACWGEGVCGDMSVQGQYHSRGRKERGHRGEGTGLGTENSLLGWNCIEALTNHKTLLLWLAPCFLTHQTIYRFDLQPRHLLPYRALCSKINLNILLIYQIRRAMLAGNLRSINKYKIVVLNLSDFLHCSQKYSKASKNFFSFNLIYWISIKYRDLIKYNAHGTLGILKCMTFTGLEIILPLMSRFSKCESCPIYLQNVFIFL